MGMSVDFIINGRRLTFWESEENCHLLLSDDAFVIDYIRRAVLSGRLIQYGILSEHADNLEIIRTEQELAPSTSTPATLGFESSQEYQNQKSQIEENKSVVEDAKANKGKFTEFNKVMTIALMQIRGSDKYQKLFNDKKSNKSQLWNKIGQELIQMGFNLGEKSPGEKCRQKFANCQKGYIAYINNMKQTGAGPMEKPWYFDEIDAIIGDKHKICPPMVIDTEKDLTEGLTEEDNNSAVILKNDKINYSQQIAGPSKTHTGNISPVISLPESASTEKEIKTNRFKEAKASVKPSVKTTAQILQEIHETTKESLSENRNIIIKYFKKQEELQEKENEFKGTLIKLLSSYINKDKNKKRKRQNSDSDSE